MGQLGSLRQHLQPDRLTLEGLHRLQFASTAVEDQLGRRDLLLVGIVPEISQGSTWIIPVRKWLATMVSNYHKWNCTGYNWLKQPWLLTSAYSAYELLDDHPSSQEHDASFVEAKNHGGFRLGVVNNEELRWDPSPELSQRIK